jgi:hypothetical protein
MSAQRSTRLTTPAQRLLGFGNVSERSIRARVVTVADLLGGR